MSTTSVYCCGCADNVEPRLTNGKEIYPHRKDLYALPFWKCDTCGNYVGCHHKTRDRTKPLGAIPTPEIKRARSHIHAILDPIWKSVKRKQSKRKEIYRYLSDKLGYEYHTAEIRTIEEARKVYMMLKRYT